MRLWHDLQGGSACEKGRTVRALVVDDEPVVLRVLSKTVERLGYTCVLASAAGEALEAFPQGPFELIVTDILMPGMNGLEFITQARKALPRTAIVVVTGLGGLMMSLEALRRGADEYVVKPFGIQQIDCAVVRAREKRLSLVTTEKETHQLAEKNRRLRAVELAGSELILTATAARLLVESVMTQLVERTVHELRNQLSTTRGPIGLLGLSRNDGDVRRASRARDDALLWVQRATDVERLGALQRGKKLEEVDLNVVVEREVRRAAERTNRCIALDAALDLPAVPAEPELLRSVVRDVLACALARSAPRGKVRASTRFRREAGEVAVLVSDAGPRLSPDERERVLALLGHEKTGISFCRAVIGAHGGRLWIERGRNGDTAFVFTLPVGGPKGSVGSIAPRSHEVVSKIKKKGENR